MSVDVWVRNELELRMAVLRAMRIWLFLAAGGLGIFLAGAVREPVNYFWLFTMGCWASLDIYWAMSARQMATGTPAKPNYPALPAMVAIYALYCLPLSWVPLLGLRVLPQIAALEWSGVFLCVFGVGFAIWARYCLAENWNAQVTLRQEHRLVRRGPYAMVRHPIYFGFLTAAIGMVLVLGEVRGLVLLYGVQVLLKKMMLEEEILRATFPEEYPAYERQCKRLVPWVW